MPIKLKCPVCEQKFSWDAKLPWPNECPFPNCRAEMGNDRADDDIVMPFIRASDLRARNSASDDVYRQMEKSSEHRAESAASHLGLSASDMAELKVTDLKDARHPGEIAAVPVNNEITKVMDKGIGGFQGANGAEFAAGTKVGHYPNQGARTMTGLQRLMGK